MNSPCDGGGGGGGGGSSGTTTFGFTRFAFLGLFFAPFF